MVENTVETFDYTTGTDEKILFEYLLAKEEDLADLDRSKNQVVDEANVNNLDDWLTVSALFQKPTHQVPISVRANNRTKRNIERLQNTCSGPKLVQSSVLLPNRRSDAEPVEAFTIEDCQQAGSPVKALISPQVCMGVIFTASWFDIDDNFARTYYSECSLLTVLSVHLYNRMKGRADTLRSSSDTHFFTRISGASRRGWLGRHVSHGSGILRYFRHCVKRFKKAQTYTQASNMVFSATAGRSLIEPVVACWRSTNW